MVRVQWTGAAGLIFKTNAQTILVDPYFSRVPLIKMLFGQISPDITVLNKIKAETGKISAIIAGHTHFDHALDIPFLAKDSDCLLIGSKSLDTLMALSGMPGRTIICNGNEKIDIGGDASVEMIPSSHGLVAFGRVPFQGEISPLEKLPMKSSGYRVGNVFSPLVEIDGKRFFHLGSAAFIEKELADRQCEVLFLCVPGWKKFQGYPERVIELLKPETIVLFHYDAFFKKFRNKTPELNFLDMDTLIRKIQKTSSTISIIVPDLFETMEF